MNVVGIQLDTVWESPEATFERVQPLARRAVEEGASLLVLPELFATGFSMNVEKLAQSSARVEAYLRALAYDLQIFVVGGLATAGGGPEGRLGRNFALAVNRDGEVVARYQKIHPFTFGGEHLHYEGGGELAGFEVDGIRVSPYVCYDLRFPEAFRAAAHRTDLYLVIANWPAVRRHAWRTLLAARAIENQAYVLGVNRCGEGGGLEYSGDSILLDPLGEIVGEAAPGEGLVSGRVSATRVVEMRERFSFLKDRRPEVYANLK